MDIYSQQMVLHDEKKYKDRTDLKKKTLSQIALSK
jgi:hypothetical protein